MDDQIKTLLARGKKLLAIKLVRQQTGWGLKESKDYVDAIEQSRPPGIVPPPLASRGPPLSVSTALEAKVLALIQRHEKVEAIKLVHAATNSGLRVAKDYVDALELSCALRKE